MAEYWHRQRFVHERIAASFHVFGLVRVPIFRPCKSVPLPEIRLPCIPLLVTSAMFNVDWAARVSACLLRIAAEDS